MGSAGTRSGRFVRMRCGVKRGTGSNASAWKADGQMESVLATDGPLVYRAPLTCFRWDIGNFLLCVDGTDVAYGCSPAASARPVCGREAGPDWDVGWDYCCGRVWRRRAGGLFSPGGRCSLGRFRRLEGESSLIAHFSVVAAVWGGAPVKLLSGRLDRLASVYAGAACATSLNGPKQPLSLMTEYALGRGKSIGLGIC